MPHFAVDDLLGNQGRRSEGTIMLGIYVRCSSRRLCPCLLQHPVGGPAIPSAMKRRVIVKRIYSSLLCLLLVMVGLGLMTAPPHAQGYHSAFKFGRLANAPLFNPPGLPL